MMPYLQEVAALIKAALPPYATPPEGAEELFILYAVLVRVKGQAVTSSDVHDAWCAWMLTINPEHAAILPFDDLDDRTKLEDRPYVEAIHSVAQRLKDTR
ncbi:DUF7701 domain-containing protein [Saccharothrix sp. Mg75]|uniref:DUF7701 domain-containing protein n=1 Tax=Saccharothrix sp. Mg75 TaxID=3445357 RepID=UPI003EEFA07B